MGYYNTNSQENHDSDQFITTLKYSSEFCELNKKMPEVQAFFTSSISTK